MHPGFAVQAQFRFGEAILKARTLLLTGLPANRRAKSFFRLAPLLAATLAVGSCFAPAVRGTGPSDSLPSEDAKVGSAESAIVRFQGRCAPFCAWRELARRFHLKKLYLCWRVMYSYWATRDGGQRAGRRNFSSS